MSGSTWAWILLGAYGTVFLALAPRADDAGGFYAGTDRRGHPPGTWWLFATVFIAWIFAKSVTNAANLGGQFGLPGAVAYAAYWVSIPVAGLVIVAIRRRYGVVSLSAWLTTRFGRTAAAAFLLAVLVRLYNEVWSNTAVVASFFGPSDSTAYYAGAVGFTVLTLGYTLKGGLRTSIWTDALQAGVFGAFLLVVLVLVLPAEGSPGLRKIAASGDWTLRGGVDLVLVALLQSLSYPFHDPVLTDRAFLADARTTRRAFLLAGGLGALSIFLFGLVGVTAFVAGTPVGDEAPRIVANSLGMLALTSVNVVMLTSAGSTLDSTLSSVSRATSFDLPRLLGRRVRGVAAGRAAMVAVAILGILPLFTDATILQATTISGTMVLGLAPIFLLGPFLDAPPAAFHLAFWTGIAAGVAEVTGRVPAWMELGDGRYASLLGVNVAGTAVATGFFLAAWALARRGRLRRSAQGSA